MGTDSPYRLLVSGFEFLLLGVEGLGFKLP